MFRIFLCFFGLSSLSIVSGTNSNANNAANGSNYTSVSLIKDMTFIKVQITELSIVSEILETTSKLRYEFVNLVDKYGIKMIYFSINIVYSNILIKHIPKISK